MPFAIPTLAEITERTRQAFRTEMPGSDPWAWPNNIYVSAKVIAGRVWEAFQRLKYIEKQAFPLTATGEYLDRHAQTYGLTRKPASKSAGLVTITEATAGTVINAGDQFQRSDGTRFVAALSYTVPASGGVSVEVRAAETGSAGNTVGGTTLAVLSATAGLPSTVTVASGGLGGGAPIETDDELRDRLLERLQNPPHGGSRADYIRWAKEISGVTRAWVVGGAYGPGTVGVWFTMDNSYANGIPQQADVDLVQAYLDERKPVTATVIVKAPTPVPVGIEVVNLRPYTAAVVNAVRAEIEEVIKEYAIVSTSAEKAAIRVSWIWQAVANASGETYHTVKTPTADIEYSEGTLPVYDSAYVRISG